MTNIRRETFLVIVVLLSLLATPVYAELMPRDFFLEVAKGNVPGHKAVLKFGQSTDIQTTWTTVWENNTAYPWAALDAIIPTAFNISSTDVTDVAGGDGAWNVTIIGLDNNWVEQNETIQMNGQDPVETLLEYTRINFFYIREAGATGTNAGLIYAGVGTPVAGVPPAIYDVIGFFGGRGTGRALACLYSVPVNHTLFVSCLYHVAGEDKETEIGLHYRWYGEGWIFRYITHAYRAGFVYDSSPEVSFPGRTDLCMCAKVEVKGGHVSAGWEAILIDNTVLNNSTLSWSDGSLSDVVVSSTPPTSIYAIMLGIVGIGLVALVLSRRGYG